MSASVKVLLIIAHGSRSPRAIEEIQDLARRVADVAQDEIAQVHYGFLNHGKPDVPAALEQCAKAGGDVIYVLPWFLNSGVHLIDDIPAYVAQAQKEFPQKSFQLLTHIGSLEQMPALIRSMLPK